MSTNKVALQTVEQFMEGYTPIYMPLFALFLGKSKAYAEQVGQLDFKRVDTVGDIRAKVITPKDNEIKQISVGEGKKSFKKYFLANQFTQSNLQDPTGINDVIAQVLEENNKLGDDLLLLGGGSSVGTVVNNGLFWSADANYKLEDSVEVAAGTAADHLKDMHTKIMTSVAKADAIAGRKLIIIYGTTACAKYDSLYANTDAPFKKVLAEVLGAEYTVIKLPAAVTPASVNGWIVVNLDQVELHYTTVPKLDDQGVNAEMKYTWHNFLVGSMMLEVRVLNAIVRQPVTFA